MPQANHTLILLVLSIAGHVLCLACWGDEPNQEPQEQLSYREAEQRRADNMAAKARRQFYVYAARGNRFVRGDITSKTRRAFLHYYKTLNVTAPIESLLVEEVDKLPASQFVLCQDLTLAKVVAPDGELRLAWIEYSLGNTGSLTRLRGHWQRFVFDLQQKGYAVPEHHLALLRGADEICQQATSRLDHARHQDQRFFGRQAVAQASQLHGLVRSLSGEPNLDDLKWRLGGHDFPGGTLSDLILYLDEHRIGPRPNCQAGVLLGRLQTAILAQVAVREGVPQPQTLGGLRERGLNSRSQFAGRFGPLARD